MITIHKYAVPTIGAPTALEMPRGAELLHVAEQDGRVMLWAEMDTDELLVRRMVFIVGTGQPIRSLAGMRPPRYVGTAQIPNPLGIGGFVWHVFDGGEV